MKIAIVQFDIRWCDPVGNRAQLEEMLWQQTEAVDLIVLPEMFNTGFVMQPEKVAEPMRLHTHKWLLQMASQFQAVVLGSMPVKVQGVYKNRLLVCFPDGKTLHYDKRHLFTMSGEQEQYTAGTERLVFEHKGWKICPLICYDLRFPVFSRNTQNAYDLLVYVANWPASRQEVWNTLLKARALENACYCVGVNRIGVSPETSYAGDSQVLDFKGKVLTSAGNKAVIQATELSKEALEAFRQKFPVLGDADDFTLIP